MKFISLGFWAIAACVTLVSAASFSNPLKAVNGSDPHIVYDNGYYYLMTTTWTNLQITRARTLEGLKTGQNKVVWTDSNSARCCNVWAPELHKINNVWYIYYTAGNSANLDGQRSHVLRGGASPWDSFSYAGQLTRDWGIDGTVLRFPNQNYFVWSCFPRANWQSLCIAPMTSPTSIGASRVLSEPTQSWEQADRPVQEGPAALYHGSSIFLAYSASFCWTSSYQLGLLTYKGSGDPTLASSWAKSGPVFSSANGNYGTGHNGFFTSPDGKETWNVYHATAISQGACDGNRYTAAKRVDWTADGKPIFGRADRVGTVLAGPSGE
ncbi:glycoside hydrolase family 43 protein [Canariomyces notabilis]|uniref:Glycoside hydrolase family 43 protein n=1 Tax=Canariomyces notabilis TaxID=2074819 RepID=A0AAN6QBN6_9PEZI|nr:glycoside hydrolase family 43 protein [Canariomyces arenarius]